MNGTVAVLQPPCAEPEPVPAPRWPARRVLVGMLLLTGIAVLLGQVFLGLAGTTLHDVRVALGTLSFREAIGLTGLWAAGIFSHSFVLTGALPRLTRRRALTLNLTGSAVSNVLPFGGAAGMSLNYLMIRSWGMDAAAFASFTFVSNLWVVLLKLLMPLVALVALTVHGGVVTGSLRWVALGSIVALTVVLAVIVAGLSNRTIARRAMAAIAVPVSLVRRLLRRPADREAFVAAALASRDQAAAVMVSRWMQLSAGMLVYGLLQALLLWACLTAVGGHLDPVIVLAGFAVERVMTMVVLTPGGAGFAEAGSVAALVALGGDPASVAAGVLLYRVFTFALEIPVGGSWLAGWFLMRRRRTAVEDVA